MAAAAFEGEIAEYRDIVPRPQRCLAAWAAGGGHQQIEAACRPSVFVEAEVAAGIALPVALQLHRQAVNHHVEEAADQQPRHHDDGHQERDRKRFRCHQITLPSWKMGRYMATIRQPTRIPSTAMIMGSSRVVRLSTALSTEAS